MKEFGLDVLKAFLNTLADPSPDDDGHVELLRRRLLLFCDKLHYKEFGSEFVLNMIEAPIKTYMEHEKKTWLKGKSTIGVIGQYASGKTTFINALFSMGLPRNRDSNTALPTYIYYNNEESYRVATHNDETRSTTKEFIEFIDLKNGFPFSAIFQYLVVGCDKDFLNRLSVLDTPGFSNDKRDEFVAEKAIKDCDTIFFCKKITKGQLDKDIEIPFIERNLKGKPVYIVLTYCDLCPNINSIVSELLMTLESRDISVKGIIFFGKKSRFIQQAIDSSGCDYDLNHFLEDELMMKPKEDFDWKNLHDGYRHLCNILKNEWCPNHYNISCFVFSGDWKKPSGTDVCMPDLALLNGLISCILNDRNIVHRHSKDILLNSLAEIERKLSQDVIRLSSEREMQKRCLTITKETFSTKKNDADYFLNLLFTNSTKANNVVTERCSRVTYCTDTYQKIKNCTVNFHTEDAKLAYERINFDEIEKYGEQKAKYSEINMEVVRLTQLYEELKELFETVKSL